jgi:hypothetical protein
MKTLKEHRAKNKVLMTAREIIEILRAVIPVIAAIGDMSKILGVKKIAKHPRAIFPINFAISQRV